MSDDVLGQFTTEQIVDHLRKRYSSGLVIAHMNLDPDADEDHDCYFEGSMMAVSWLLKISEWYLASEFMDDEDDEDDLIPGM